MLRYVPDPRDAVLGEKLLTRPRSVSRKPADAERKHGTETFTEHVRSTIFLSYSHEPNAFDGPDTSGDATTQRRNDETVGNDLEDAAGAEVWG